MSESSQDSNDPNAHVDAGKTIDGRGRRTVNADKASTIIDNDDKEADDDKVTDFLMTIEGTLIPEQQDLYGTLPQTTLRPLKLPTTLATPLSVSVRPRGIKAASDAASALQSVGNSTASDEPDYVTMRLLGQGGMGTVHLARQVALGRAVAVKQVQAEHRQKQSVKDEFLTEAVLTGKLEHPNIVPIYEVGKSPAGDLFYSMKNIKGQAWSNTIGTLSLDENLGILLDVCDAIAFAHAEGVIHRDLKPQNIMTGGFGEVLVLDWGLGLVMGPDTTVSSLAGTPAFAAPEMINPPFTVGPHSDIYLLGANLFMILTGKPPHGGASAMDSLRAASENRIDAPDEDRLRKLDPSGELMEVALRAMATDVEDRYQTVTDFQKAVRDFRSHHESLELSSRAQQSLDSASTTSDYTHYSRAVFGFEEASKLWDQNEEAKEGIITARLLWALCAEDQGDFDLAISLLDDSLIEQREILGRVTAARDERDAQKHHARRLRRFIVAAGVLMLVGAVGFGIYQRRVTTALAREKQKTEVERGIADEQRRAAQKAEREAIAAAEEVKNSLYHAILSESRSTRLLRSEGFRDHIFERLTSARRLNAQDQDLDQLRQEAIACLGDFVGNSPITYTDPSYAIYNLALHPEGIEAAITTSDGSIRIVRLEAAKETQRLQASVPLVDAWYLPNGQELLATSAESRTMFVFGRDEDGSWKEQSSFDYIGDQPTLARDVGQVAFYAGADSVEIRNVSDGSVVGSLEIPHDPELMEITSDGRKLIIHYSDASNLRNYLALWDIESGKRIAETEIARGHVYEIAISANANLVGVGSDNGMSVHELPSLRRLVDLQLESVLAVTISPDEQLVAFGSRQKEVRLLSIHTGQEVASFRGPTIPRSIEFEPAGSKFVVAFRDSLKTWDIESADERTMLGGHKGGISSIAFSADGNVLASSGKDHEVKVWDPNSGELLRTLTGFGSPIQTIAFHPSGDVLVTGEYRSGDLRFWDLLTGESISMLDSTHSLTWKAAFTPDGGHLAAIGDGLKIWRVTYDRNATVERRLEFELVADVATVGKDLCVSPDGKLVAFDDHSLVRVWNLETGQEIPFASPPTLDAIHALSFLPDSRHLVFVAAGGGGIQGWDVTTGRRSFAFGSAAEFAQGYSAMSANGRLYASVKPPGIATIWDVENRRKWFELPEASAGIWCMAWRPNGRMLAVAHSDGKLSVWQIPQIRTALKSIDLDWTFEQPKPASDKLVVVPSNMNQPSVEEMSTLRLSIIGLLQQHGAWDTVAEHLRILRESHDDSSLQRMLADAPGPSDIRVLSDRATAYASLGEWKLAKANLLKIHEQVSDVSIHWLRVAPALVLSGNDDAYIEFCKWLVKQPAETEEVAARITKVCLLRPGAIDSDELPVDRFTTALDSDVEIRGFFPSWGWATRALLAYRSGDTESAIEYVTQSEQLRPTELLHATNLTILSLAEQQLGHPEEASTALKEASQLIKSHRAHYGGNHDLLIAEILYREAEAAFARVRPVR